MTPHFTSQNTTLARLPWRRRRAGTTAFSTRKLAAYATAIGKNKVSCDDMLAGIQQAQLSAAEGRAPFLAQVAGMLDQVIAMCSGG
jgi:hypothetical protein